MKKQNSNESGNNQNKNQFLNTPSQKQQYSRSSMRYQNQNENDMDNDVQKSYNNVSQSSQFQSFEHYTKDTRNQDHDQKVFIQSNQSVNMPLSMARMSHQTIQLRP